MCQEEYSDSVQLSSDFHDPVTEVKQVLTRKGGFIMKVKLQDPLNA